MKRTARPIEILQTAALDCGPAALTSLLRGIGVPADYAHLRDLCGTDIDGTSIDALEDVGRDLGGDLEQIVTPIEQALAAPESHLPAIVVTTMPDGFLHFIVVWRRRGPFLQVMDPAQGRRWVRVKDFAAEVYRHEATVDAGAWAEWVTSEEFLEPLRQRLHQVGLSRSGARDVLTQARTDCWRIAHVEAACRATESVLREIPARGRDSSRLVRVLMEAPTDVLDEDFWSARPGREGDVLLRGAVLLRAVGKLVVSGPAPEPRQGARARRPLTHALLGATRRTPGLAAAAGLSALITAVLEIGLLLALQPLIGSRSNNVVPALVFLILGAAAASIGYACAARVGRGMEGGLRAAVDRALPRIPDAYFRTRPASDTVERVHLVHRISELPGHIWRMLAAGGHILIAAAALVFLTGDWQLVLLLAAVSVVVPLTMAPVLAERDLRLRTQAGTLSHYLIDALLGATALRAHRGIAVFRARHEKTLIEWAGAHRSVARASALYVLLADALGFGAAGLLVFFSVPGLAAGSALVVAVLALGIPVLGADLGVSVRALPTYRSLLARLSDPLSADLEPEPTSPSKPEAIAIGLDGVSANQGGVATLRDITLRVSAGSHVAIVGPSGAGKSTLLGVLLGWFELSSGSILLDGRVASAGDLVAVRRGAAWVSPAVAIWDRPLADNLAPDSPGDPELADVQARLSGLHGQRLGTGGSRLSGGQGQRVRIARAMGQPTPSLVVLDEPCRGLEAATRSRLLAQMRRRWSDSTLLCVTHDIEETKLFPRVLVLDQGRLVEDGSPEDLLSRPGSRYAELLDDHQIAASRTWGRSSWRHVHTSDGTLTGKTEQVGQ